MPVECLLPVDTKSNTNVGHRTMFELSQLLVSGKEAFVDSQSTRAVTDYMKQVLDKVIVSSLHITVMCDCTSHIDSLNVMIQQNNCLCFIMTYVLCSP
jgi:hypothetical protein